jgi:hypothetical protein
LNYTQETLRRIQVIAKENPEMSFGEVIVTCFQSEAVKNGQSLHFFTTISDEDIYTIAEKVKTDRENPVTEEELQTWVNSK